MWPNSRLQAGEITDFILPAWCSLVKVCGTGHSHSGRLCRELCPDRSPPASCEKQQERGRLGSIVCQAQRFVSPFGSKKAHSGAPSHPTHNGPRATERHSGFAKKRLMFIIIAINGITVIVVIIGNEHSVGF